MESVARFLAVGLFLIGMVAIREMTGGPQTRQRAEPAHVTYTAPPQRHYSWEVPVEPPPSLSEGPASWTRTDPQSGNTYFMHRDEMGNVTVNGSNARTGATWRGSYGPNGRSSGIDADMNTWTYDSNSGVYLNSNGTSCVGTGDLQTCTGGP